MGRPDGGSDTPDRPARSCPSISGEEPWPNAAMASPIAVYPQRPVVHHPLIGVCLMSTEDPAAEDFGVPLGRWYGVVRRARLSDLKRKAVALTVGSYADTDGTSVKCGVARLAADCEMGYSTARRYLSWLREVGLIELVRVGNRKAKRSDEYRLTIHPHTEKLLNALGEAEYRDLVDGLKSTNRAGEKGRRLSALTQELSADSTDGADASALAQEVSADARDPEDAFCARPRGERRNGYLRSPMSEPPPKPLTAPPTGGAPPPDPRRPEPPTASGSRIDAEQEISAAHHPAQDRQLESLPHASAAGADVYDFFTREAM